jgi:endo-alpha-1,4-polygalactosaminidase (GH114 family)
MTRLRRRAGSIPIAGLSMTTQVNYHSYWSGSRENYDAKKKA